MARQGPSAASTTTTRPCRPTTRGPLASRARRRSRRRPRCLSRDARHSRPYPGRRPSTAPQPGSERCLARPGHVVLLRASSIVYTIAFLVCPALHAWCVLAMAGSQGIRATARSGDRSGTVGLVASGVARAHASPSTDWEVARTAPGLGRGAGTSESQVFGQGSSSLCGQVLSKVTAEQS